MTTPNPPSGQALPTEPHAPGHAAPHGWRADLEAFEARILAAIREAGTPGRLQELAGLCREVAAGARDAGELVAWLGAHGL